MIPNGLSPTLLARNAALRPHLANTATNSAPAAPFFYYNAFSARPRHHGNDSTSLRDDALVSILMSPLRSMPLPKWGAEPRSRRGRRGCIAVRGVPLLLWTKTCPYPDEFLFLSLSLAPLRQPALCPGATKTLPLDFSMPTNATRIVFR
ncbi:hypothetical protein CGRA01v4_11039 [Colletotrichum graminicola]|nr:hypothetical protein CGRA01v4_11039 [Colletotrichum graminicola]